MRVEIDKFGRLIIPKTVRNHLGIKPGTVMELVEQDHEILLRLINQKPPLKREGGLLIYTGEALDDVENSLEDERENRLKKLF